MMAAGIQREQLAVEHVRKPRQRVPVGKLRRAKGPNDTVLRNASLNDAVSRDIIAVGEINKLEAVNLQKYGQCNETQAGQNETCRVAGCAVHFGGDR